MMKTQTIPVNHISVMVFYQFCQIIGNEETDEQDELLF